MRGAEKTISSEQGCHMAKKITELTSNEGFACHYIETSAKTGIKINESFTLLGEEIKKFTEKRELIRQQSNISAQKILSKPVVKELE